MSEWKPIESAPRDGTRVLLFARDKYGMEYWDVASWAVGDPDLNPTIPEDKLGTWFGWSYRIQPSKFQPLPHPPIGE